MNEKLIEWNDTDIEIGYKGSLDVLLHERFTENAECVAAKDQSGEFTYAQLEAASNAVSDIVRAAADQNVCVLVGNRAERLAYVTGIIKAGKTYVPLGMNTPVKRNMEIVSNVEPGFILTDEENREDAELIASECGIPAEKVLIRTMSEPEKADCGFTPSGRTDDSIAYIIHTSGSNGKPKGVLSPDLGLRNLCWCCRLYFDITPDDSTCAVHNCSFDASIIDMFPFVMAGATIHFIPDEMKADIFTLNGYMIENGITIQELPTTLYHHFIDLENPVLHTLIAGGEKMLKYRKKSYQIFNAYGPSEASVYSTIIKLDGEYDDIPIGRPIYNTKVLILREDGTIADIGEEGEICVTGVHLAKGYLNEPEQQAKAFVPSVLDPDKIMYKTGDVGMWTEEGYILCSGRKDFQIKHRGFRIELDEIRHHLMEMPEIADCAVLYHKRETGGYIACFYVPADGGEIGRERLRSYSLEFLPEYMVPGKWLCVSEIPVTANHKIDRRALEAMLDKERSSAPAGAGAGENVTAGAAGGEAGGAGGAGNGGNAAGSIESRVRSIWAEVLDVDPDFGADETFNELGGHSIMSLVMLKKIKEEFGVNISFIDFQKKNSFGDLLAMIRAEVEPAETCSFASDREHRFDDFPLTGMQQAYYFGRMDNMHLGTTPTHLYIEVDIKDFDKAKFVRVLNRITEAHDALRLRVSDEGTQRIVPQQIITEDMITFADASQLDEEGKQRTIVAARKAINSIDIDYTDSPLARVTVVLTGDGSARVGLYLDGFVADGWSQDILLRDFDALWKDETQQLAEEKYLFRDYVNFVNSLKTGEAYEKARDFWMERLPELPGVPGKNGFVRPEYSLDDLYGIIYTSGSTGMPKGVMLHQAGLINCMAFTRKLLHLTETDRMISLTNLCHDMSIYDIFGILAEGAAVVLPDKDKTKDPDNWLKIIRDHKVTLWNSVPAITEMMLTAADYSGDADITSLRVILMGGEKLKKSIPTRLRKLNPEIEIYNVGGPTEATIWSIYHKYQEKDQKRDRIPQGRGVDNVKYFVMNDDLQLCPCDVQGLMYTEGINVSRGYLKEEEKTKQVFITNPYTGNLMYNTGDLGKYLPNGEIDILGRNDDQIKINGKRIELGEIETCCLRVDKVSSAVAVYSEEAGMIALFYAAGEGFDEKALREELEKQLPEYMLPAVYTRVSEMPVTSNGKIDRKKLASQIDTEALMAEKATSDRPLNRIESALMEIYRENLNRSDITAGDNFFRAGGDSLKAIKLLHEITEKVDPNVQLTDIFRFPTVEKLAEHIGEGAEVIVEARHNEISDRMDLSLIQKGMWFQAKAAQMQHSSEIFMLAGSFTIDSGSFDHRRMETAVNRLISSNPELRTRIFEENYEPYLRYEEPFEYEVQHVKTDAGIDDVRAELEETVRKEAYSFDSFPLFSFRSAETADGKAVVAFGIHHIISDAHSVKLLLDELEGYYTESGSAAGMPGESGVPGKGAAADAADVVADEPDAPEMSGTDEAVAREGRMLYNDYTVWQEESLAAGSFSDDFEFWKKELDRLTPHRFTEASGEWGDYRGASVDTGIDRKVMQRLERMCAESSSTIYDGIAAAVNVLMKYYFEDRHTAVGLGYAGRNLAAFENTIGCFAVSSMECTQADSSMSFAELVSQTGRNIKESLAHSSLPFNVYAENAGKGMEYSLMPYNIMINDISGGNSASADVENVADGCAAAGDRNADSGTTAESSADTAGCGCDAGASCKAQAGSVFEDFRYSDAVVPADIMVALEPGKTISIRYRKNMFEQAEIDVIRSDFRTVIEAAAAESDITVAELERRLDNM